MALITFVIYGLLPSQRKNPLIQKKVSCFFLVSCILVDCWMIFWHWFYVWVPAILLLLLWIFLVAIYVRLSINYGPKGQTREIEPGKLISRTSFWIIQIPFSVFLSWISLVTQTNLFIAILSTADPNASNSQQYSFESAFLQSTTTLFTIALLIAQKDFVFSLTVWWGLLGLAIKQRNDYIVFYTSSFLCVVVGFATLVTILYLMFEYWKRKRLRGREAALQGNVEKEVELDNLI